MPIPQLSKTNNQNWRKQKSKLYIPKISSLNNNHKNSFTPKRKKKKISIKNFLFNRKTIFFCFIAFVVLILFLVGFIAFVAKDLPSPNKLMEREVAQSTKIYDRSGEKVLYDIHGDVERTIVNIDELPDYIKFATIAIEDKNFYKHSGVSLWGIFRGVVWQTLKGGRAQGGSTLTQQFVKNAILTSDRKITRKVKEWVLAYKIEKEYSKDEILQLYFNEIPYGSTAYGVEAASRTYFDKSAKDLSLAEAAILAALPQAPSRYSPYGSNKDLLISRQHYILDLMVEQNYINKEDAETAKNYELIFKKPERNIKAPHFVMYIKELLSEKYGQKMVEQGGLKIYTTLDLYKQEIAETVIKEQTENYPEKYNANNASLVSIDPKTGQVLAMVGSRDYFDDQIDGQVNVSISDRQPGSSMKPFVFASLFEKGYTPNTIIYDVVTNFSNDKSKPYEPHNYDNQEHGPVDIRKALAGSLNIPAVKAIYLTGIDSVLNLANELGYTTLKDKNRFGLSLVLGGGEVKLLEHTNAYSAFAREGIINPVSVILKVEDKDGKIIEEYKQKDRKVMDAKIARMINSILSDNNARAYAFGLQNWLTLGSRPVAAKTGTTNDYKDAWTIGYTPSLVTGIWVGNNNNKEMKRGSAGGVIAAPIWKKFMEKVLGDTPVEYFKELEDIKTGKPIIDGEIGIKKIVLIDKASGLLATENTPESFIEEKEYSEHHSILYYVDKDEPLGDSPETPEKDPQFELWESRVQKWVEDKEISTTSPPTEYDNLHTEENKPQFNIKKPTNNSLLTTPIIEVEIEATAPRGINRAEYYINQIFLTTNPNYPFNLNKDISFLRNGFHNLKIRVCDDIDNCSEKSIEFNLNLENNQNKELINISWSNNINGLALNKIDFPLSLNLNIDPPTQTAKIKIYYKKDGDEEYSILQEIEPIENTLITGLWGDIPESGNYKIYAEAIGWSGQTAKSEEISVNITNEGN